VLQVAEFRADNGVMSDTLRRPPLASVLGEIPMFAGLHVDDVAAIAGVVREQDARSGEVLLTQGRRGDQVLIVLEGAVEVQRDGEVLEVLGRGALIGEVAVFTDHHRNATVIARTVVHLGVIDGAALQSLAHDIPLLSERLGSVVRIRRTQ